MKAYEVIIDDDRKPQFAGTMAAAKAILKSEREWTDAAVYYGDIRVVEVEVQTDKEGIIFALNHVPVITRGRTWRGTPRGGLKEILPEDHGEAATT